MLLDFSWFPFTGLILTIADIDCDVLMANFLLSFFQFAHRKEDLRPTHPSIKNKTEVASYLNNWQLWTHVPLLRILFLCFCCCCSVQSQLCRSYKSPGLSYSPNSRFLPHVIAPLLAEAAVTPTFPTTPMTRIMTPSPTTSTNTKNTLSTARAWKEWSPQDDGIEVALPCSSAGKHPSRESVNAYIDAVLSGRTTRRLPVFSEICYY